jgi:hypothetical protein
MERKKEVEELKIYLIYDKYNCITFFGRIIIGIFYMGP